MGRHRHAPAVDGLPGWGEATGRKGALGLASRPFADADSAQFLGTAFTYHHLNRVAEVLLADSPIPSVMRALGRPAQKISDLTVGAGLPGPG